MSVKASISLTETQNEFARGLVSEGRYPSLSAVLQRGLELVRDEVAEKEALRLLLEKRKLEPSIGLDKSQERLEAIIARRRAHYGLEG